MEKVKKIKVRPWVSVLFKIFGTIICILICLFVFYLKEINDLRKLDYSKKASHNILFSFHKDDVLKIGKNKTLNKAFESEYFNEKNINHYVRIDYFNGKHFIDNINKLIKMGYSDVDINIIFKHGDDEAVRRFIKHEKVKYLEEFFSVDYAKLDYYDRYVNYSLETGEDEETTVLFVNLDMDKDDYSEATVVDNFSNDMLVNKHRSLKSDFSPDNLVKIDSKYASTSDLKSSKLAYDAFIKMHDAAEKEGYQIVINSAYRSYQDQEELISLYLRDYGQSYVDKYVAKAGFSEHQTGLAYDVGSRNVNVFINSKEYQWMVENAYKYGFILRFKKNWEHITGFRSEAWHFRYVGEEIAKYIQENNISLEEYWAIFLDKD